MGSVIIVENDRPVGIVTERDFVEKIVAEDRLPSAVRQRNNEPPAGDHWAKDSVVDASKKMAQLQLRRLPVVVATSSSECLPRMTLRAYRHRFSRSHASEGINTYGDTERGPMSMAGYCEN